MRFLERNLEDILWNEHEECVDRGFNIAPFKQRYRQLALGNAGIADLVYVGFSDIEDELVVQVIECKKDIINLATIGQACRYEHALWRDACDYEAVEGKLNIVKILVGQKVDDRGDFWSVVESMGNVQVFTYDYTSEGIAFTRYNATDMVIKKTRLVPAGQKFMAKAETLLNESLFLFLSV